jgi:8-oxo-dGTP pyrophosphatase MutT (NUDIX family)
MYFSDEMVRESEANYGQPQVVRLNYPTPREDFEFIRSTQKNGRSHDITFYLYHDNRLAVTRKPVYPTGCYRPSSGGLNPGESLEAGAAREAFEEMGIELRLERYLLRSRVDFVCGADRIRWTSHVFQACCDGSEEPVLNPQDRHEIVDAVWADEETFFGPMRRGLLSTGLTGLLYRVHLHDRIWRLYGWGKVK